jgi:hypothetical protein
MTLRLTNIIIIQIKKGTLFALPVYKIVLNYEKRSRSFTGRRSRSFGGA